MNAQTPNPMADLPVSESYARHQRQRLWQIIAPVAFGILLILVVLGLVIHAAVSTDAGEAVSQWADTSVIWLSLPALLFVLVMTVILFMIVWLLARLLKILPVYTLTLQHYAAVIADFLHTAADKLVAPIISINGFSATVSAFMNALLGRRRD